MAKFKKKFVIEATQITERIEIVTLEGTMVGEPGDWLCTGIRGEQYLCKDDIFRVTYEPVANDEKSRVNIKCSVSDDACFSSVAVFVDDVKIVHGSIGGEPGNNTIYRDYDWIVPALSELAKKLGADVRIENFPLTDDDSNP